MAKRSLVGGLQVRGVVQLHHQPRVYESGWSTIFDRMLLTCFLPHGYKKATAAPGISPEFKQTEDKKRW
jgi:hypothetical protein